MNRVPGSKLEPDKSPGEGAKGRNPAQGVCIGEIVPQRSRLSQASPANHGEPLMRQSMNAATGRKFLSQQCRAEHPAPQTMHIAKGGQQTKSQGQGYEVQTERTAPYQGDSPGDQRMEP